LSLFNNNTSFVYKIYRFICHLNQGHHPSYPGGGEVACGPATHESYV